MNAVTLVPAHFAPLTKDKQVKVATGETTKGMFGGSKPVYETRTEQVQTGTSDCRIDDARLARDLAQSVRDLNDKGWEVVTVTPVFSGRHDADLKLLQGCGAGYGYGYSYTSSLVIVARHVG